MRRRLPEACPRDKPFEIQLPKGACNLTCAENALCFSFGGAAALNPHIHSKLVFEITALIFTERTVKAAFA